MRFLKRALKSQKDQRFHGVLVCLLESAQVSISKTTPYVQGPRRSQMPRRPRRYGSALAISKHQKLSTTTPQTPIVLATTQSAPSRTLLHLLHSSSTEPTAAYGNHLINTEHAVASPAKTNSASLVHLLAEMYHKHVNCTKIAIDGTDRLS